MGLSARELTDRAELGALVGRDSMVVASTDL